MALRPDLAIKSLSVLSIIRFRKIPKFHRYNPPNNSFFNICRYHGITVLFTIMFKCVITSKVWYYGDSEWWSNNFHRVDSFDTLLTNSASGGSLLFVNFMLYSVFTCFIWNNDVSGIITTYLNNIENMANYNLPEKI